MLQSPKRQKINVWYDEISCMTQLYFFFQNTHAKFQDGEGLKNGLKKWYARHHFHYFAGSLNVLLGQLFCVSFLWQKKIRIDLVCTISGRSSRISNQIIDTFFLIRTSSLYWLGTLLNNCSNATLKMPQNYYRQAYEQTYFRKSTRFKTCFW